MKHMKKMLLVVLLCSFCLCSHAEEFTLSMAGLKVSKALPGYFIRDVVVSQREDSCVGYLHPHSGRRYSILFFEKSIRGELKEFLANSMPEKPGLLPLIIRVNRIFIYQPVEGVREYTCLQLSLSFIFPVDKEMQEDFTTSVSLQEERKHIPASLPGIIARAFDEAFSQYISGKAAGLTLRAPCTREHLDENPFQKPGYFRCFAGKNPRKGLYRTWFDFRDNLPDTTTGFKAIHYYNQDNPRLSKAFLKFPKGVEPVEVWGFCEGDSVYVFGGRSFSLLEREGDLFITWSRSSEYTRDVVSAAIFGWFFAGLAGASLTGGIAALSSDPDQAEKLKLDLFNGKLLPVNATDYTMISSRVVFFLSKVSDPGATLDVYVDGQKHCGLNPGTYLTLDLSCHHTLAAVKLVSSAGGEKMLNIPLQLFKTEVYLLKANRNHLVSADHLHDQMKKDILWSRTREKTPCRAEIFSR